MLVNCKHCYKEFEKKAVNCVRSPNHFCSRSCSTSCQNKLSPRRIGKCVKCGEIRGAGSRRYCEACFATVRVQKTVRSTTSWMTKTLAEMHSHPNLIGKHPSWRNAEVRSINRRVNKKLLKEPCRECGYSKHVELAHIKDVADFEETATLGEVNSESNVLPMCRNCHWELDHGFLPHIKK